MLPSEERRRSLWNWLRPQFSLRVLIALVTLFAIGFPIWYRRPYQFTEYLDGGKTTRTTTWQRQWGGSRLQHGEQVVTSGPFTTRSHFQHGELHGSYSVEVTNSAVTGTPITPPINRVQGRYFHGEKDGPWEYHQGNSHGRMNWQNGVLHGVFEFSGHHTGTVAARFNSGRLVELNGKPVADDFVDRFQNKHLDNRVAHELLRETNMDVVQMPLKDCLVYLSHMHNVPIFLDAQVAKRGDDPLTGTFQAMDLKTLLILITAPRGLACDYRYGCLRITTREDAANWLDPTGVEKLIPPKDSDLARVWNESVSVQAVQKPLAEILHDLALRLAIPIQTASIDPSAGPKRYNITLNLNDAPFRHALGNLLEQAHCRCQIDDGKLSVEPQTPTQLLPAEPAGER